MFEAISPAPPDAILGLTEAYKSDPNPDKVNLGVGVYLDNTGKTPVLACVQEAEERLVRDNPGKSYMPISGDPVYGEFVRELIFGDGHEAVVSGRAVTAHTPGGTGGLRVGADLLKNVTGCTKIWVSSPTWANHKGIFESAGFEVASYPYYDAAAKALDAERMLAALDQVPSGEVVLLHVCCHNPTGVDPTPAQWAAIAETAARRGWLPFLDFAYQGFGQTVETDREPVAHLARTVPEMLVTSSFSKNFGLYQDRVGAFTLLAESADAAGAAFSHVKRVVRVNYSNPPAHGGHIVRTVLRDEALRAQWLDELAGMRTRIQTMRGALVEGLRARGAPQDFSFITRQNGMFSFSGLGDEQVAWLREEKSIYIVKGGRINVAGIRPANIDYLCDALMEALA